MTIIITMAGLGSRFQKAGYDCPKYMIQAKEKTLFEWALDSLPGYNSHTSKYIFVVLKKDCAGGFIRKHCAKYGIETVQIVELDQMTEGQATTCMMAIPYCDPDEDILVYNIDTYVEPYSMKYEDILGDGHIPCFRGKGDHWSFVKLNQDNIAICVREKERISENCSLGAYYFSSAKLYGELYKEYYADNKWTEKSERYIAPMYNLMIERGMAVTVSMIEAERVHVLGTPRELEMFLES